MQIVSTKRNGTANKLHKNKAKQAQARHTAKIARYAASNKKWLQAQALNMPTHLAISANPKPKTPKQTRKVNKQLQTYMLTKCLLGYAHLTYTIGTGKYTNVPNTVQGYIVNSNPNTGLYYCYVPARGNTPAQHVYAHPKHTGFSAGLQQFVVLKVW